MKPVCFMLLIATCLCSLRIILQSEPQDPSVVVAKGYIYQSQSTSSNITFTNDPGHMFREERCPANLDQPLQNGYVFYRGEIKCQGYVETFQQGFPNRQDNTSKYYEDLQFPQKLSALSEFLKVRKADKFDISFNSEYQLHGIHCTFAHSRKLTSQLYSQIKHIEFVVKKSSVNQIYGFNKGTLRQIHRQGQLPKGKFNRSLVGKGLHQSLAYLITIPKNVDIHQECSLMIEDYLPESFYLDADQFDNLKASQVLNIQKPAFLAKQYWYRLVYPLSSITSTPLGYTFSHPIHFRYQQPSRTHEYISVTIPKSQNLSILCPDNKLYAFQQTYNPLPLTTKVPVGLKQSQRMVTFVTLIVTISAALFINKELSKRQLVV